ncbi:hypothetical protein EVAR_99185_1 [Eumeta japonica]|uniref:Uncharacterized protein n=1 Tax=Eumeta variegata TaxID=151549 RepID=A0A4C1YNV8_EUMVA|nr:hypothetical protein EVAR_99185_1 [Eumeta japonica]
MGDMIVSAKKKPVSITGKKSTSANRSEGPTLTTECGALTRVELCLSPALHKSSRIQLFINRRHFVSWNTSVFIGPFKCFLKTVSLRQLIFDTVVESSNETLACDVQWRAARDPALARGSGLPLQIAIQ